MTAAQLLIYINAALLIQIATVAGWAIWQRHRRVAARPPSHASDAMPALQPAAAWPGWRSFRVARRELEDAVGSQCSFHLVPVDGKPLPAFKPGQFLTFSLEVADTRATLPGSVSVITRCYSLSDRPWPDHYRVTIKRVPAPHGRPEWPPGRSSNHFHDHVHEGDLLTVRAPSGHFFIDPDPTVPAVLIAGGIGITPMMSMVRWCLDEQPGRELHLYYGIRNGAEQAFKSTLERFAAAHPHFRLHVAFSQPGPDDQLGHDYTHAGHVDLALLRRTLPHGRRQFYVCGPAPMMDSLVPALAEWGVPRGDIHFEAFGPASVRIGLATVASPAADSASAVQVKFTLSGRTLSWDGRDASLLEFAERHGVAVESGCRAGSCGSCQTRVVSGVVQYDRAPDYEPAPGHCLLCVGRPVSAVTVEA